MGISPEEARAVADLRFGGGNPATWYIGLSLTEMSDDGTNFVEPVGMNYARVPITNNLTSWLAAATTSGLTIKSNNIKITWATPSGFWGAVRAWGAFTTATGGVPRYFNKLDDAITATSSTSPVEIDIGQLQTAWGSGD